MSFLATSGGRLGLVLWLGVLPIARPAHASDPRGAAPALLRPGADAEIRQNDPATDCGDSERMGYGYRLDLEWTKVDGAEGYDVWVSGVAAKFPIVNKFVQDTKLSHVACHGWVADLNRDRWQWRVRARLSGDRPGPWSSPGKFHFAPCRFDEDHPCESGRTIAARPQAEPVEVVPGRTRGERRGDPPPEETSTLAPTPVSPPNGAAFDHFPRTLRLVWQPVPDSQAYQVSVDVCCQSGNKWWSQVEPEERFVHEVSQPELSFQWYGAQPGRWRVRAVGPKGEAGAWSPWQWFEFRR